MKKIKCGIYEVVYSNDVVDKIFDIVKEQEEYYGK
jgi:hypothetical protein